MCGTCTWHAGGRVLSMALSVEEADIGQAKQVRHRHAEETSHAETSTAVAATHLYW